MGIFALDLQDPCHVTQRQGRVCSEAWDQNRVPVQHEQVAAFSGLSSAGGV